MNIQYITDEKGMHKAVIIPIKEWDAMKKENKRIKNKLAVLDEIKDVLNEVQEIKERKRPKGKRLTEFLNEVFSEEVEMKEKSKQKVLSLAGAWQEMSDEEFKDYLQEAKCTVGAASILGK